MEGSASLPREDLAMPSGSKTTDLFILQNLTNPVVLRAVKIVQNLLENKDFFVKTYGAVLNEIARHYKMPELSDEDIMNIRAKLLPCRLRKGTYRTESVYMQCIPRLKQIHIFGPVSAFYFHVFRFLFLTAISFFQWLERIECDEDSETLDEGGAILTIQKPTIKELKRHALVMVCSTFHEVQHVATDILLNPVAYLACESKECTSPAPNPAKLAKVEKRTTPEHIGSTKHAGQIFGDSGVALEEKIFGCRLVHREKRSLPTFLVIFELMLFLRNTM
jgi:hypothetical protein